MKNLLTNKYLLIAVIIISSFFSQNYKSYASLGCSEYGMAYEDLSGYCKCTSGYVFGKNFLGEPYCVSADSLCRDKFGVMSDYNSLTNSCECSYGYILGKDSIGKTQCISENDACKDQLGYNARSAYGGKCECSYGYVIEGDKCVDGDNLCRSDYGIYASYNDTTNNCECDEGYTFDDNDQCVKKQNNVYFTLKELDTDNKLAVIKSDYDSTYYSIRYNTGCYSTSFNRYLNHQVVVNLGTDYYLDTWDKIVLQNDNETCDIVEREKVDSSYTLTSEEEEDKLSYEIAEINQLVYKQEESVSSLETTNPKESTEETTPTSQDYPSEPTEKIPEKKVKWYTRIINWFIGK